jgi:N-acetylmuramoyl-L-alanine amidase
MSYAIFFWDTIIGFFNPVETAVAMETVPEEEITALYTPPAETAQPLPESTETPEEGPDPIVALIDPGHGGTDAGTSADGVDEHNINLKLALRLLGLLQEHETDEFKVMLTRTEDTSLTLEERLRMANEESSFLISLHCDYFEGGASVHGSTTFFKTHEADQPFTSKQMATIIQSNLVESAKSYNRGIDYKDVYYLLNHTTVPAVIVEVGFMSNPDELRKLQDDSYIDLAAEGLKNGILELKSLFAQQVSE